MRRLALATLFAALTMPTAASAVPCNSDLPVLFVVQDKSGSMKESPDPTGCPTCPSKWDSSKGAVTQLTSTFSNRFRFGLELFPHDSTTFNCTAGTTVGTVPSTSAQIAAQYAAVAPGGGTPTAVSLKAAKSYLLSLNLKVPGYVLLLTDGLPNCNTALNGATCTTTTAGCKNTNTCSGTSCCGLGAKDCLDDSDSRAAAAELLNAGFKVYVVGFGASATGNNQVVLDGIASAGGTSKGYAANDQAGLSTALNAIAFNATTCCKDVCANGATQCDASGAVKTCAMDASLGCTNWISTPCAARSACVNGACVSCTDACTLAAKRCSGATAQVCVKGAEGCTEWQDGATCGYAETCSLGACNSCEGCVAGAKRCNGASAETCTRNAFSGCTSWTSSPCASGSVCSAGSCQSCTTTCTAGNKRCNGVSPESCVADARGCTAWKTGAACTNFCSGGSCGVCGTTCTLGTSRCNGNGVETCVKDPNGCTIWMGNGTCQANQVCSGGACTTCTIDCGLGTKRCSGKDVEECSVTATGCKAWVKTVGCAGAEVCTAGACTPPCADTCKEGEAKCDPTGLPQACVKAATGCTVWKAQPACDTASKCHAGKCLVGCSGGEIETCAPGYLCTGLPQGNLCVPDPNAVPGTGTNPPTGSEAPAPGLDFPDEEATQPTQAKPSSGTATAPQGACGCGAAGMELPVTAGFIPALVLLRRRRRA